MERAVFVYTTWPTTVEAEPAGRTLVERRLAACVNILPGMISHYRWEGKVERAEEAVMIVKTRASLAIRGVGRGQGPALLRHAGDPGDAAGERGEELSRLAAGGDGRHRQIANARRPRRRARRVPDGKDQYVRVPSITPLSSVYSRHLVPQSVSTLARKSRALSRLPCSACHMP